MQSGSFRVIILTTLKRYHVLIRDFFFF